MTTMLVEERASFSKALPGAALEVEVEGHSPAIAVVRVHRESVSEHGDDLARYLNLSVVRAARFVILDLAGLGSISGAELQALVEFRRELSWRGGEVWLAGLRPAVWLALRRADQDQRFTIRASVAQVFAEY